MSSTAARPAPAQTGGIFGSERTKNILLFVFVFGL